FDLEDVHRTLVAGKQVLAVVGLEKTLQGIDACDDQDQVVLSGERENRVDKVMANASISQRDFQPIGEEREQFTKHAVACQGRSAGALRMQVIRPLHQAREVKTNAAVEDCVDAAERRAAERERILGSCRLFVDRKEAAEAVELIG